MRPFFDQKIKGNSSHSVTHGQSMRVNFRAEPWKVEIPDKLPWYDSKELNGAAMLGNYEQYWFGAVHSSGVVLSRLRGMALNQPPHLAGRLQTDSISKHSAVSPVDGWQVKGFAPIVPPDWVISVRPTLFGLLASTNSREITSKFPPEICHKPPHTKALVSGASRVKP